MAEKEKFERGKSHLIGLVLAFIITIFIFNSFYSTIFAEDSSLENIFALVTIGDIIQNQSLYEGKIVTISGKYGGWGHKEGNIPGCESGPPVTRSDWCIYDETGCIYVAGAEILECGEYTTEIDIYKYCFNNFDPSGGESMGTDMIIKGRVKISDKGVTYVGRIVSPVKPIEIVIPEDKMPKEIQDATIKSVTIKPGEPIRVKAEREEDGKIIKDVTVTEYESPIKLNLTTKDGLKEVVVRQGTDELKLISKNVTARTKNELEVEEDTIYLKTKTGRKEIKIMPDVASQKAIEKQELHYVESIELKDVGKPIYEVNGVKKVKLLWFIPIDMSIKTEIDAETGKVEKIKKPWWSFLAW